MFLLMKLFELISIIIFIGIPVYIYGPFLTLLTFFTYFHILPKTCKIVNEYSKGYKEVGHFFTFFIYLLFFYTVISYIISNL